jgi:TRAP-type C4-dicarboxylate transport system permease large subunit
MYISDATSIGRVFFTGTVNIILIALSVLSVAFVVWTRGRDRAQERASASVKDQSAVPVETSE